MSAATMVVDCSIAMTWAFRDEMTEATTALAQRLTTEVMLVPGVWFLEIANVLALAERKGRFTLQQTQDFVVDLAKLQTEVDSRCMEYPFDQLLPLCRTHQLTSYDAAYLELALRRKLPLATLDEALRKAAKKTGVKLLGK
jgi:predicted nucleic acid-binding protein